MEASEPLQQASRSRRVEVDGTDFSKYIRVAKTNVGD